MKKRVVFVFLISLIFCTSFILTADQTVEEKAYACLEGKVKNKCSTLSTEERIFSLLSINQCAKELLGDVSSKGCWPKSGCRLKTTSQAVLALRTINDNKKAEEWLLSQVTTPSGIDWLLQVEAKNETSCTISYEGSSYEMILRTDKTIVSNVGKCLTVYEDYWLRIDPICSDEEFEISCDIPFLTSLLYKKDSSNILYVSKKTNSALSNGITNEKISSLCFKEGTSCNYEGSLWAAFILKNQGYDVSSFIPYLVTGMADNSKYLPEAFLYPLTNEFRNELLIKQKQDSYWLESQNKFYDTAVALFPFQKEELKEKTNSKDWLTQIQGTDGCWQSNVRDTAFLLYSIWPRGYYIPPYNPIINNTKINNTKVNNTKPTPNMTDCEDAGYHCLSNASCTVAGGSILKSYSGCFAKICCSKEIVAETCSQQSGQFCDSDEDCVGGTTVDASDDSTGKFCCVLGTCEIPSEPERNECEDNGGICKIECSDEEQSTTAQCSSYSNICCIGKTSPPSRAGIWILLILIVLVILGIIFRKKLKDFLSKLSAKFSKKGKPPFYPIGRFPPSPAIRPRPGLVPRKILPPPKIPMRKPVPQRNSEFDDVLKKLKEIGK